MKRPSGRTLHTMRDPQKALTPRRSVGSFVAALVGFAGFSALAGLLVTVMVAPALAVTGVTATDTLGIFESLPEYMVIARQSQLDEIVAKNTDGTDFHIATVFDQNRETMPLDEMSDYVKYAAVAGEDRRFYNHGGVDVPSVVRAAIGQVMGSSSSGASTITMQLVRNIRVQEAFNETGVTDQQRAKDLKAAVYPDLGRKLQEMKYAIGLEKKYSKQTILAAYLNIVGMGVNTYGVQSAAEEYFGISAGQLSVAQAASLVAIVQNPVRNGLNSPANYRANQARRNVILGFMESEHYITGTQYQQATSTPVDANFVHLQAPKNGCLNATIGYRFVCEDVLARIANGNVSSLGADKATQLANWKHGGYKVYVSIVPDLQNVANSTVRQYAPATYTGFALGASAVTTQVGTGRILDMAQNKSFNNDPTQLSPTSTSVNFSDDYIYGGSQGFQPGSTYKPFTLLAFLMAGHGVNETFNAGVRQLNQSAFPDTCPDASGGWAGTFPFRNDENESGPYTVMRATARSVNSVFLQMGTKVDQCSTRNIATSLGVHRADGKQDGSDLDTEPSCVIGGCVNNVAPVTEAAAFAGIADSGYYCHPILIDQVLTPGGRVASGENADCGQSPLVTPDVAHAAAYAMAGVLAGGGTAGASNPNDGTIYIGKTGTTDNSIHTWMVGSSHKTATAVWVGNISGNQPLRSVSVNRINAAVLRHSIFRPIARSIDAYPGLAGGGNFPAPSARLLTGTPASVPGNLVGGTPQAARAAIELAQLTYVDGGTQDSTLPAGTVSSVSPAEGASVSRGSTVAVYTSNGQAATTPNVVGQSYSGGQSQFQAAGFSNINQVCQVASGPSDPSLGKVVTQTPTARAVVNKSTPVTLTITKLSCP
jgi:membrane peptidoglycan carboxypeptidase